MKTRSLILILLIVLLPIGLLTGLGVRLARDEKTMMEQRFRGVMEQRLQDVNMVIARQLSETERQLQQVTAIDDFDVSMLRERVRSSPHVTQLFVLGANGDLLYPSPGSSLNGTEQNFLRHAAPMFTHRDLQNAVALAESSGTNEEPKPSHPSGEHLSDLQSQVIGASGFHSSSGWFVWYWDRGLNLVFWQRRPSGHLVGASLERSRWISDVISVLPETDQNSVSADHVITSFRVVNAASETVYDWGPEIAEQAAPFGEIAVTAPLASWRLQCFVSADAISAGTERNAVLAWVSGFMAFALTLIVLAWLLYRDYSRDIREAMQQVSFVNQVSHELKTPLTNIRMYAELLERDLETAEPEMMNRPRQRLAVITSEAQRLSRLIGNVLTFARQSRKTLEPHPCETNIASLVQQIVDRFRPSLTEHGIEATVEITSPTERASQQILKVDPDFIEQILGNLISNVERYAVDGKSLHIRCARTASRIVIDVIDAGGGIAPDQHSNVFRPFNRISSDLRTSTGTGIGLSIAGDLARLHHGDVSLLDSKHGCWFRVELGAFDDLI